MAIDWGPYNGHLRVGIDHTISPSSPSHSDTSVTVTWKYYVDSDGWNFNDNMYLHEGADGWAGTTTYFDCNTSGASILVDTHSETYSISYNSGSKSANANITGAYNGATPSHSVTVNLPNRPVAAPSAGEAPTAGSIGVTSATISWSAPTDNGGDTVDKYELQVSTGSGFGSGVVYDNANILGSGAQSQAVTGLNANTHYYARVRAHNSAGWGDWTSSTYCQFTTNAGGPDTPGGLAMTSRDNQSINIAWKASSANGGGTVNYEVQCASDSGFTNIVNSIASTTATSAAFGGLASNTTFYFRVRASNTGGTSSWSATLSAATMATPTYTDANDVMGKMNNLASAVADKLVHLGTFIFQGRTNTYSLPASGGSLYPSMNVTIGGACTQPDPPTQINTADGNSAIYQINYPGTYMIEFGVHFESVTAANQNNGVNVGIFINGHAFPQSTDSHGGMEHKFDLTNNEQGSFRVVSCVRQLVPGDTIGFLLENTTNVALTGSGMDGDLSMWSRVTMVGF